MKTIPFLFLAAALSGCRSDKLASDTGEDDTQDTDTDDTGDTDPQDTGDTDTDDTGDTDPQDTGDTDPQDTGDTDPKDTGDTDPQDTGDISSIVTTEEGTCYPQADLSLAKTVSFTELSVQQTGNTNILSAVISDQTEMDAFTTSSNVLIDTKSVDFSAQQVLFAQIQISSTCGVDTVIQVVEMDGVPHLALDTYDPGGTCEETCDMYWEDVVAVAVDHKPEEDDATACARLTETCE